MKQVLIRVRFLYAIKMTIDWIEFTTRRLQNNVYYFSRIEFLSFKVAYKCFQRLKLFRTTRASVVWKIRVSTNKWWSKQQFFFLFNNYEWVFFIFFFFLYNGISLNNSEANLLYGVKDIYLAPKVFIVIPSLRKHWTFYLLSRII